MGLSSPCVRERERERERERGGGGGGGVLQAVASEAQSVQLVLKEVEKICASDQSGLLWDSPLLQGGAPCSG